MSYMQIVNKQMNNIDPSEVQRQVELAFFIEASIPKNQCTSRFYDVGPKQKFEYFITSAINTGKYVHQLAERIKKEQSQPKTFYDLAYNALIDSTKSRQGKIINYGLLETMFPLIVARYAYSKNSIEALKNITEVLKNTSKEDVNYVAKMRHEIYSKSNKQFKRNFEFHNKGNNVFEHYTHHKKVGTDVSKLFVNELITNMPLTKIIYDELNRDDIALTEKINQGFNNAKKEQPLLPFGAMADFTACALFLYISDDPSKKIID